MVSRQTGNGRKVLPWPPAKQQAKNKQVDQTPPITSEFVGVDPVSLTAFLRIPCGLSRRETPSKPRPTAWGCATNALRGQEDPQNTRQCRCSADRPADRIGQRRGNASRHKGKVSDFSDRVRERTGQKPQSATGTHGE